MAVTKLDLDRQAKGKAFTFGDAGASGQAAVVFEKGTAAVSIEVVDVKGSQRVRGNIAIEGDLVVTGAIDTQSQTNTNVKDKTITVNDGGTTAGAAGSGINVEGDGGATIGAVRFDNTLPGKFSVGDGSTQKAIVVTDDARTPTTHTHTKAQITDFSHTHVAADLPDASTTAKGIVELATSAETTAGLVVQASDTRLSDSRAPTAHTHGVTDLTATGTRDSTTVLYGDNTWKVPAVAKVFTRTTITGTINGINTAFTLGVTPSPAGSEQIFQNGIMLLPSTGNDYTITGTAVTFAAAPVSGDQLQAFASS